MEMMRLKTPIISVVIGEGGSGGALALGVADRVFMLDSAVYSVISPEGCASILWKDAQEAPRAAESLCLTAKDAKRLGIIEEALSERKEGDEEARYFEGLRERLLFAFRALPSGDMLREERYRRFRQY